MKKLLAALSVVVGLLLLLVGGLFAFASFQHWQPPDEQDLEANCQPGVTPLQAGKPFSVVSWNLQFGASRKYHFFYDGGPDVVAEPEVVAATTAAIADALRVMAPDLALLQEVDRDSHRTGNVDQLPAYEAALEPRCVATATYYRSAFVPTPAPDFMGKVLMDLAVIGRSPISRVHRTQLAVLDEPAIRQAFNLKRALMTAEVAVDGWEQPLAIGNTHLSAFSHGDGTLQKQVAVLEQWMASRPPGQPWILAGDMNLLPPGADPSRLAAESDLYDAEHNAIESLVPRFSEISDTRSLDPDQRTYLPWGAHMPDRKIDWVFYGGPMTLLESEVKLDWLDLSDHQPIRAVFRIGPEPEAEAGAEPEPRPEPEQGGSR